MLNENDKKMITNYKGYKIYYTNKLAAIVDLNTISKYRVYLSDVNKSGLQKVKECVDFLIPNNV